MLKEDLNAFEYDTRVNVLIEAEYKLKWFLCRSAYGAGWVTDVPTCEWVLRQ
jgi:hypothetical protein